jgi:putative Holliday junction resolvase
LSRILAIDFGERRIGLALSDTLGITAQGLPTLDTRKTRDIFTYIENIIKENDVREVKKFIQELVKRTKMEVIPWDERLTTVQSLKTMREMGTKQKHKEVTDRISATLILQSYLDSAKHEASWRRLNDLPKENET